jgi:hypothetical protein
MWLILAAGSVAARGPVSAAALTVGMWALVALFGFNTLGNLRGQHPLEKWGMSGVTIVLGTLCAVIAINR